MTFSAVTSPDSLITASRITVPSMRADCAIAGYEGARVHMQHLSAIESVVAIRDAKARGVQVTCEASPHHLLLTDEHCCTYDTNYKMNPPLRTAADVKACIEGVKDGTIDILATDHAPHLAEEKGLTRQRDEPRGAARRAAGAREHPQRRLRARNAGVAVERVVAGARQSSTSDVVTEVEALVIDPDGRCHSSWCLAHPLPVAGHEVKT